MSYKQFSQSYENGRPSRMHRNRTSTGSMPTSNPLKRPLDIVLVDDKELRIFANGRNVKLKCQELLREIFDVSSTCTPLAVENSSFFASHDHSGAPVRLCVPNIPFA